MKTLSDNRSLKKICARNDASRNRRWHVDRGILRTSCNLYNNVCYLPCVRRRACRRVNVYYSIIVYFIFYSWCTCSIKYYCNTIDSVTRLIFANPRFCHIYTRTRKIEKKKGKKSIYIYIYIDVFGELNDRRLNFERKKCMSYIM